MAINEPINTAIILQNISTIVSNIKPNSKCKTNSLIGLNIHQIAIVYIAIKKIKFILNLAILLLPSLLMFILHCDFFKSPSAQ